MEETKENRKQTGQPTRQQTAETKQSRQEGKPVQGAGQAAKYEDLSMKMMMQFFAEELLPFWGIEGKAEQIAPTELTHLELRDLYQDSNLVMADGSWKHFEFQSKNEGLVGLKRFRVYEAITSDQYKVPVTTYVLFSGGVKNPMTEFSEGVNTYRVVPIIMQNYDADKLLEELLKKQEQGKPITKEDLVQLSLCPLMGGEMPQKDRFKAACRIMTGAVSEEPEVLGKVEAVIYAMAEKFLEETDMKEVEEAIRMTRLGRMLVEDGREQGLAEGREQGIAEGREQGIQAFIRDKLEENTEKEKICEKLEQHFGMERETAKQYIEKYK